MITGLVVTYNTKALFKTAYESLRAHLPQLPLIIVDGSDEFNDCHTYVKSLAGGLNTVYQVGYNIGHGDGMHYGLRRITSKYVLVFDSDIEMLKSPVDEMLAVMDKETYAAGWLYYVGRDGYDYGTPNKGHSTPIPYIHPYFMLLNLAQYNNFAPFVHHGAPCYKAFIDIYDKGLSGKVLKSFAGLTGHTSGAGINWVGKPSKYIRHDFGGTRKANKAAGKPEIKGLWVK